MTRNWIPQLAASLLLIVLVGPFLGSSFTQNHDFILVNAAYVVREDQKYKLEAINNRLLYTQKCQGADYKTASITQVMQIFDECYLYHHTPLHVITNTVQILGPMLAEGSSRPTQISGDVVTLFGVGYMQSRLFFVSEKTDSWMISVRAKHDTPAPVILEIWLDEVWVGDLVFDKGDETWETLSFSTTIPAGLYHLHLWYVNDFFDVEQGLDRNAYIEYLLIERQEFCCE